MTNETSMMADVIREVVRDTLEKDGRDISDLKVERFDSGGANYTSILYRVIVTTAGDELRLFAKVASFGEMTRDHVQADWIYYTERYVYTKLAKVYDDIQRRYAVPLEHRFVFPKFFGCSMEQGSETVVTEDLCARGYSSYDRFRPMDWEYASTSMKTLARFHALSFAYEKEQPEEFKRVAKEMESKMNTEAENLKELWVKLVENSVAVIEEEKRERVRKIMYDENTMNDYAKPVKKVVLVHGDYRLSNLLFKKQDDGLEAVAVDYQLVNSGCLVSDIVYFISLGSDHQFRAKYFHKLIDYYYEQLALSLERLSVDIVDVYPRETFDMELKKKLPQMVLHGVMILPAVTVDPDEAPKLSDDVANLLMEPNDLYKERFNGIIDDCIEWGVI
ncbi:unnamed protein product, partial [Iphiclides podalirius]